MEFLHFFPPQGTAPIYALFGMLTYSQESLASSFEGMNLLEEALVPYEELENLFYRVSKEKNMSWFGSLVHPDLQDDSLPLLSLTKKPYRDLILANSISTFDFRVYLLARECQLLAKMGKISSITTKAGFFLGAFGKRLREVEVSHPVHSPTLPLTGAVISPSPFY